LDIVITTTVKTRKRRLQNEHELRCPYIDMTSIGTADHLTRGRMIVPVIAGALAFIAMLAVYFGVLTLISGWDFTVSEFLRYWYYVIPLAFGFGIQIGLYVYLKQTVAHHHAAGKMVVASGTTSTAAMISCCAHYLANILPIVGAAGLVTLVAEYQVELFWVGLAFNAGGIAFIGNRILRARNHS